MKRQAITTLINSILFAAVIVLLIYLDPNPNKLGQILLYIFLPLWGFSIIPSYLFSREWLNQKSFDEGARIGARLGSAFQLKVFLIPIVIAPYLMVRYYRFVIKKIKQE
jgi:hypothetical protein